MTTAAEAASEGAAALEGGRAIGGVLRFGPRLLRGLRFARPSSGRRNRVRRAQSAPVPVQARNGPELVAIDLSDGEVDRLTTLGFETLGRREIKELGSSVTRLRVPKGMGVNRAMATVSNEASGAVVARNETYGPLSRAVYAPEGESCGKRCEVFELTAWTDTAAKCTAKTKIGVVDTAADLTHPSIDGAQIVSRVFRADDRPPSDVLHGTAVLSLLVGEPDSDVVGVAHGAQVVHADAFHGEGDSARTDVFDLVSAIDWMIASDVAVLNLSFSGPDNRLLERAILAAQTQGIFVISAAGRPDRSKSSGYPARYEGVVAVTAVDSRLRPSRLSVRGAHVSFAAPGVGLTVAHASDQLRLVDGTSFAAPFVAAAYAMAHRKDRPIAEVTRSLADSAQDLGASGRDPVYGWGLLQYSGLRGC